MTGEAKTEDERKAEPEPKEVNEGDAKGETKGERSNKRRPGVESVVDGENTDPGLANGESMPGVTGEFSMHPSNHRVVLSMGGWYARAGPEVRSFQERAGLAREGTSYPRLRLAAEMLMTLRRVGIVR